MSDKRIPRAARKEKGPKPMHHRWTFWLGVILVSIAMIVYVMSASFSVP